MLEEQYLKEVRCGLQTLDKVFNNRQVNYRVLGSVLVAAINGKPHRTLGDIDILLDQSNLHRVVGELQKEGYKVINMKKLCFSWLEAHKENCIGFTFLLVGKFCEDYFSYKYGWVELRISGSYLTPTKYSLLGYSFVGIPLCSVYEGLKISDLNPKRTLDNEVVKRVLGNKISGGNTLEQSFQVYLLGVAIPHLYPLFSRLYNIYGGLRVKFGKRYEIWD